MRAGRRAFLKGACAWSLLAAGAAAPRRDGGPRLAAGGRRRSLKRRSPAARTPISTAERRARIAKVQRLMARAQDRRAVDRIGRLARVLHRHTLAALRAHHRCRHSRAAARSSSSRRRSRSPPCARRSHVGGDVRPWNEADNPFAAHRPRAARPRRALGPRGRGAHRAVLHRRRRAQGRRAATRSCRAIRLIRACRMIKSPAELALMQTANDVTIAALRHVHGARRARHERGGSRRAHERRHRRLGRLARIRARSAERGIRLSARVAATASRAPRARSFSWIAAAPLQGYQSDISRTWVFGEPNQRQRKSLGHRQARPGDHPRDGQDRCRRRLSSTMRCAATTQSEGGGRATSFPGLSHRTGHGIGLDGHEPAYLVHGDSTPLEAGMCFSDEPGIYIPGEFGVRLEDCWYMTAGGAAAFHTAREIHRQSDLRARNPAACSSRPSDQV